MVPDETASQEILKLRNKVKKLEEELKSIQNTVPVGTENLSNGNDVLEINYEASIEIGNSYESVTSHNVNEVCLFTWNELFYAIAPKMIWEETSEDTIKHSMEVMIEDEERETIKNKNQWDKYSVMIHRINVSQRDFDSIMIQFWALGYINKSNRHQHWTLTPYGLKVMLEKQAIKKGKSKIVI